MLLFEPRNNQMCWCAFSDAGRYEGCFNPEEEIPAEIALHLEQNHLIGFVLPHGGQEFYHPITELYPTEACRLTACCKFFPPGNRLVLNFQRSITNRLKDRRLFILSDTAFFYDLPETASRYALPAEYRYAGIEQYGGDGLCHQWVGEYVSYTDPYARLLSVHIGDCCSVAAIKAGIPVETSMGFSPLGGISGLHTCGNIDPSIPLLWLEAGMQPEEIETLLANESGLAAISGRTGPLAHWINDFGPEVRLARQVLTHQLLKAIGSGIAAMDGVDILAFAVEGALEFQPLVADLCDRLSFLGVQAVHGNSTSNDYAHPKNGPVVKTLLLPYKRWQAVRALLVTTLF